MDEIEIFEICMNYIMSKYRERSGAGGDEFFEVSDGQQESIKGQLLRTEKLKVLNDLEIMFIYGDMFSINVIVKYYNCKVLGVLLQECLSNYSNV